MTDKTSPLSAAQKADMLRELYEIVTKADASASEPLAYHDFDYYLRHGLADRIAALEAEAQKGADETRINPLCPMNGGYYSPTCPRCLRAAGTGCGLTKINNTVPAAPSAGDGEGQRAGAAEGNEAGEVVRTTLSDGCSAESESSPSTSLPRIEIPDADIDSLLGFEPRRAPTTPAQPEGAHKLAKADGQPRPECYACQRCGRRDGLDSVLPDHEWERISAASGGHNILCLWCMDEIAAELGIKNGAALHFAGRALWGGSDIRYAECQEIAVRSATKALTAKLRSAEARADAMKAERDAFVLVGYRYLYPHYSGANVWRFNSGEMVNGSWPTRAEPVYARPSQTDDAKGGE